MARTKSPELSKSAKVIVSLLACSRECYTREQLRAAAEAVLNREVTNGNITSVIRQMTISGGAKGKPRRFSIITQEALTALCETDDELKAEYIDPESCQVEYTVISGRRGRSAGMSLEEIIRQMTFESANPATDWTINEAVVEPLRKLQNAFANVT